MAAKDSSAAADTDLTSISNARAPARAARDARPLLAELSQVMRDASICGLGQTAYSAVESAIKRLRLYEVST